MFSIDGSAKAARFALISRAARASVGGICYHVINRGNGHRRDVFRKEDNLQAFLKAIADASIDLLEGSALCQHK